MGLGTSSKDMANATAQPRHTLINATVNKYRETAASTFCAISTARFLSENFGVTAIVFLKNKSPDANKK